MKHKSNKEFAEQLTVEGKIFFLNYRQKYRLNENKYHRTLRV